MNAITFNRTQNNFKDTLFESVSFQPWTLEYKMVFTETRLMLEEILTELQAWHKATRRLFEADAESTAQVLARFEKLGHLSPEHMDKLAAHVAKPADAPPPGLLNKVLNTFKKGLDRLSKVTTYPPVDDAIQATIRRINTKSEDSPFKEYIKKFLRVLLKISQKGGWVASLVLLAMGIAQAFLSLPFLGTSVFVFAIVAAIMRVVADLVNGKSITYALGKAAALYGAGYGAVELFKTVMPLLSAAEAATPPDTLGGDTPQSPVRGADGPDAGGARSGAAVSGADGPDAGGGAPTGLYRVRSGDTLGAIAQAKNVTVQDLFNANRDIIRNPSDPNVLRTTMTLKIPPATINPANPTSIWAGWTGR